MATITVIDDDEIVRVSFTAYLEDMGHEVLEASDGTEGLRLLSEAPTDLVLLDLQMPGFSGLDVLRSSKVRNPEVPVIVVSGTGAVQDAVGALHSGADDFLSKPVQDLAVLGHAVEMQLERRSLRRERARHQEELERRVAEATAQLREANEALRAEVQQRQRAEAALRVHLEEAEGTMQGAITTISRLGEIRDPYTAGHQVRVARLASAIARRLGWSEDRAESVYIAGLLHDIGKIAIPIEILVRPGKLSEQERRLVSTHPLFGREILERIPFKDSVATYVYQHHERLDGSGYPEGLRGEAILPEARVLAVADIVEAVSSHRPYRPALGVELAKEIIQRERLEALDGEVVDACLSLLAEGYELDGEPRTGGSS